VVDTFPNTFSAKKLPAERTDIEIMAEYSGPAFTDQMGNPVPAYKPYRFAYKQFFQPINFTVNFYSFDSATNPIKTNSLSTLEKQSPFKTELINKLDYAWWGGIKAGDKQYKQFVTIAEGSANMEAADYELSVTWDDAVRIYIDGKLVVDEWNPSKYNFDEAPNKKVNITLIKGVHKFRVEHVELGGFATLNMKLKKA
jgi:hypothetical protein